MHSMIPMLAESAPMSFAIAPHFVWALLAVLAVSGIAIVAAAFRAEGRRRDEATRQPTFPRHRAIVRHAERPIAA